MHPHGKAKVRWDLMVAVLIVYSTLVVPFRIGFEEKPGWFGTLVDTVVDIGFALDIVLSFRTAFLDEVMGRGRIGHIISEEKQQENEYE